jgi:hypothetical protein
VIYVPKAFTLGSPFDDFAVGTEFDHTLVVSNPSVQNPLVDQLLDGLGFHGGWILVLPKGATPFASQIADELEAEFFVGQGVYESIPSESPFVLAPMLEDDLTSEVELNDGVNIPTRASAWHRVIGTKSPPTKVETLFVTIDVLEREVRVLGIEQRQSQFTIAAPFVDEVTPKRRETNPWRHEQRLLMQTTMGASMRPTCTSMATQNMLG